MDAAHGDADVVGAAYLLAQIRIRAVVDLAVAQMTVGPNAPRPMTRTVQALARGFALSPHQESQIYALLQHCHSIATKPGYPQASLRRGAFLERFVIELLRYRGVPDVRDEVMLRFAQGRSPCLDVLGITDDLYEAFECKMVPGELQPGTLASLALLPHWADAEQFPKDIVPVIATLFLAEDLEDALADLGEEVPDGLYQVTRENILGLSVGQARTPLA